MVDVVVSNESAYDPKTLAWNRLDGQGFANVNLRSKPYSTWNWVDLRFTFFLHGTDERIVLPGFAWSIYDFDEAGGASGKECMKVDPSTIDEEVHGISVLKTTAAGNDQFCSTKAGE